MKVKNLKEIISKMKDNEDIFVLWFDKAEAEIIFDSEIENKYWADIVEELQRDKYLDETVCSTLYETGSKILPENQGCSTCKTENGCQCDAIYDMQAGK